MISKIKISKCEQCNHTYKKRERCFKCHPKLPYMIRSPFMDIEYIPAKCQKCNAEVKRNRKRSYYMCFDCKKAAKAIYNSLKRVNKSM